MAVLPMKKIEICAMKRDRKAILEKLQSLGMVEIQTDNEETDDFRKMSTTSQRAKYEKRVQNTDEALQIIDKYAPEEKSIFASLEGRQEASEADIQEIIAGRWDYNRKVKKIQEISKDIAGCEAGIVKCQVAIDGLAPWLNMDIPINTTGTEKTDVMIGTMPPGLTETDIQGYISSAEPEIAGYTVTVVGSDKDQTCMVAIAIKTVSQRVEEILRSHGFTRISYFSKRTPEQKTDKYRADIREFEQWIEDKKNELVSMADDRDKLRLLADYYRIRADKYKVLGSLLQSKSTFVISGYVLERDADRVVAVLNENFSLMADVYDVPEDEAAPIQLQNPKMFASAEGVLESFGLPGNGSNHTDGDILYIPVRTHVVRCGVWTHHIPGMFYFDQEIPEDGERTSKVPASVHVLWYIHTDMGNIIWRFFRRLDNGGIEDVFPPRGDVQAGMVCTAG